MVAAFVLTTTLVLMLLSSTASVQVIHKIFSLRVEIKPALPKNLFTGVALFLWFVILTIFILRVSLFLFKSFYYQQLDSRFTVKNIDINRNDCQILIDTIYYEENKIYKVENHRYIEEVSPDFAVKVEYHKDNLVAKERAVIDGIVIPAGATIVGKYVPAKGGLRYIAKAVTYDKYSYRISVSSSILKDEKDPRDISAGAIIGDAAIGAAGGAILGEVFGDAGLGEIIGGAAAGVVVGNVTADRVVVIEPKDAIVLYDN